MPQYKNQIITLPGWGFGSMSLTDIWPSSIPLTCEDLFANKNISPAVKIKNTISSLPATYTKTIIGWSLGALLALNYCLEEQNSKIKLVLISPTASFHYKNEDNAKNLETLMQTLQDNREKALLRFYLNLLGQNKIKQVKQLNSESLNISTYALLRGLEFLRSNNLTEHLNAIKNKCLIIHGERDSLIPIKHSSLIHNRLTNSILVSIPEGTHMLPYENKSDILKITEAHEFLTS